MARRPFNMQLVIDDKHMRRDLRFVRTKVTPKANVFALNKANGFVRDQVRAHARARYGLGRRVVGKTIRIPKGFRATVKKPEAAGVYGAFVRRSEHRGGSPNIFLNRKPRPTKGLRVSDTFSATMKSGHSGIFVRVLDSAKKKIVRRDKTVNKWGRSELPIYEVFSNVLVDLVPVTAQTVEKGGRVYTKQFAIKQAELLRSLKTTGKG